MAAWAPILVCFNFMRMTSQFSNKRYAVTVAKNGTLRWDCYGSQLSTGVTVSVPLQFLHLPSQCERESGHPIILPWNNLHQTENY